MAVTVRNTFIQMAADEPDEEDLYQMVDFKRQLSEPLPKAPLQEFANAWKNNPLAASSLTCEVLEEIADDTRKGANSCDTLAPSYEGEHVDPNSSSGSDTSWHDEALETAEVPWARLVTDDALDRLSPIAAVGATKHAKITLSLASAITEQAFVDEPSDDEDDSNGSGPYQRTADVKPPATMLLYPAFQQIRQIAESVGPEQTLMVRNVPNKYSRDAFIGELHETGFQRTFDFLYLPIDPDTRANKGYAFINFVNTQFSKVFMSMYQDRKMTRFDSDKRISVTPAALQGFAANYAYYSKKYITQQDESMRPLFLRTVNAHVVQGSPPVPSMSNVKNVSSRRGNRTSLIDKVVKQQTGSQAGYTGSRVTGSHPNVLVQRFPAQEKKMQAQGSKLCVHCGTKVLASFKFCQSCGQSIQH